MMVVLLASYLCLLALFVWLRFIPLNTFWKVSPLLFLIALNLALFIPMGWGAPSGPVAVLRNSVQIVPSVAGEVVDVPVAANTSLQAGSILFRIDPTTYQAQVDAITSQLKFAELRLAQMAELQTRGTGRTFDVEQRQAEVEQLRAQLDAAKWNLEKTTIVAPSAGYVTNLTLRKGARVTAQGPVMAFIDTSETLVGIEIDQIYSRYVAVGQQVEMTFKIFPGAIYTGRVETVLQAVAAGQTQVTGLAVSPATLNASPFVVRVKIDDDTVAQRLPAGSLGVAAIYTDRARASHIIRGVLLRQVAILNYVNPF